MNTPVIGISFSKWVMFKSHRLEGCSWGNAKGQINRCSMSNNGSVWFSSFPITKMTLFPLIKDQCCQKSDLNFPAMQCEMELFRGHNALASACMNRNMLDGQVQVNKSQLFW